MNFTAKLNHSAPFEFVSFWRIISYSKGFFWHKKIFTLIAAIKFPEVKFDENKGSNEHPLQFLEKDWLTLSLSYGTAKFSAL